MKIAIFTGTRQLSAEHTSIVSAIARQLLEQDFKIFVGDASGVDFFVRKECFVKAREENDERFFAQTFSPIPSLGRSAAGLAERSTRMVREGLNYSWEHFHTQDQIICVSFPNKPCPAGIVPARSWKSGKPEGSGTWSTTALAIGHKIETWIIPLSHSSMAQGFIDVWLQSRAMQWEQFGQHFSGWHWRPAQSLFEEFPDDAHEALANGWTEIAREAAEADQINSANPDEF